jgi:hypothetical protein
MAHVWPRLWYSYWGHRPVIARLVTLLDVRFFTGLSSRVLVLVLTVQAAHAGLLVYIAWRLLARRSRPIFLIVAALIVQLSFSSLQLENFIWAADAGYLLVWASATAAFFLLAIYAGAASMRSVLLGACVLSGIVSTLSVPNGLFVWPVLLLQAWILRLRVRVLALLILTGALVIGVYLWGYQQGPPMGMGALQAVLHPEKSIPIVGMLLVAPLTALSIQGAMAIGCVTLVCALYTLVKVFRDRPPALVTVYGALAFFALLTFLSLVSNRVSPDFVESKVRLHVLVIPSRYYSMVFFCWAGLIGTSVWLTMKNTREWPQLAVLGAMAVAMTLGTVSWQVGEAANWRGYYRELDVAASALIMHVNDPANRALAEIYPEVGLRSRVSAWLEMNRLAIFSQRRASFPGRRIAAPGVDGMRCRGEIQSIVPVGDGVFRIAGWAMDTRSGQPPRDLVFADRTATIVGVARSGLRRPDLQGKIDAKSDAVPLDAVPFDAVPFDTTGWEGYARYGTTPGEQSIAVYGVLDDSGHYCRVGGQQ